ncbi:hypothetical protein IJ670_05275, partial [bacterium]|nr:hypothetical protein [bacterium]
GNGHDVKFISYILEHSWLWLNKVPTHEYFLTAPFFYPYENNLAYSDLLVGIMPLYWILRTFLSPFSAIQGLVILMCVINYGVFYYFLRRSLKFSSLASGVGAFLFAFGILRYFRMPHFNYYCQFIEILSLIFFLKVNRENSVVKNHIFFGLGSLFLVLQFYSCFTLAYFLCFVVFIGFVVSMFFKDTRQKIIEFVKYFYKYLILWGIVIVALLTPLAILYLGVGEVRTIEDIANYTQNALAWIFNLSAFDYIFTSHLTQPQNYISKDEIQASIGIFTLLISIFGISKLKLKKILYIVLFIVFLCSCSLFGFVLWKYLYPILIGAQGIRAIIRISLIALIIFSIGICGFIDKIKNKTVVALCIILIAIEQIPMYKSPYFWQNYNWSKSLFLEQIQSVSNLVPKDKKIIYFYCDYGNIKQNKINIKTRLENYIFYTTLAMWVSLNTNKYTINGYSGIGKKVQDINNNDTYVLGFDVDLKTYKEKENLLK